MLSVRPFSIFLILLVAQFGRCANNGPFRCMAAYENPKVESEILRFAPHGKKRIGKHRLEVAWEGGKRVFADEPPYEDLDGVVWIYCGYSPALKLYLLFERKESHFSGALLDDATGSLLPGGQDVLFSPGNRFYLAYEMEDGDVTEILKLYRRTGQLLWAGHNGLVAEDGSLLADFKNLRWDAQDTVHAVAVPYGAGKPFEITLAVRDKGEWRWFPLPSTIDGVRVSPGRSTPK